MIKRLGVLLAFSLIACSGPALGIDEPTDPDASAKAPKPPKPPEPTDETLRVPTRADAGDLQSP